MSEVHDIPGFNPADIGNLDGLLNYFEDQLNMNLECCLPAIVESYDRSTNSAVVQPAISAVASSGQKIPRDRLFSIPVLTLSGGGFFISFPVRKGDTGWLVASDRDISIFKQNLEETAPNTYHKHKFVDSVFIPDKIKKFTITEADKDGLVISNLDGDNKIVLTGLNQNASAGNINQTAAGNINLSAAAVNVSGNTAFTDAVAMQKTLNVTDSATAGTLHAKNGASGSFVSMDNKNITVQDGIITGIA